MEFIGRVEGDISRVRVRLDRFGGPILQLQRAVKRRRFTGPSPVDEFLEPWGHTEWRDARKADAFDIARFLADLQDAPSSQPLNPPGAE